MTKEEFILYCDKLNIKISEELYNKFFTYFEMLVEWNNKFNMTTILEEKDVFLLHFLNLTHLLLHLRMYISYH